MALGRIKCCEVMGLTYRIDYGPPIPQEKKQRKSGVRLRVMTVIFFFAFLLLVKSIWPAGTERLRSVLLPSGTGDQQAIREFVADLRQGEDPKDALTTFCRQVIQNAQTD